MGKSTALTTFPRPEAPNLFHIKCGGFFMRSATVCPKRTGDVSKQLINSQWAYGRKILPGERFGIRSDWKKPVLGPAWMGRG